MAGRDDTLGTLTTHAGGGTDGRVDRAPALFLVLELDCPTAPAARFGLHGVDTVRLGRAGSRGWERRGRELSVGLPDRHMSAEHAVLERALGRWLIVDKGSKNGVLVNGERRDRTQLHDGDRIEVGRSIFLFRAALPRVGDREIANRSSDLPGMSTLLPGLEDELARFADAARSELPVRLTGETGTGKEVLARALHALSGRRGPFVAVNCGAIPRDLVQSELFGHVKGAFSGAGEARTGLVRSADGGTLLLDEIGDLPPESQASLLRMLQEHEVLPVGADRPMAVDVRVVSATHRDLDEMVRRSTFREDLLARINGFTLALPPLRNRREDLGLLIGRLLARVAPDRADSLSITREAARLLFDYDWPRNVRELERALAAAVALARDDRIDAENLPADVRACATPVAAHHPTLDPEDADRRAKLVQLLAAHQGNVSAVAREMNTSRMQVHRWIKRYRIDLERLRS